jgi:hypothetical protein
MIDLLTAKLIYEERGGEDNHETPPWLSEIAILADATRRELRDQWEAHAARLQRLRT